MKWVEKEISIACFDGMRKVDAHVWGADGELAVHAMVSGAPGYTITFVPNGKRITPDYRIFRTLEGAQKVVEEVQPKSNNWESIFDDDEFSKPLRQHFINACDSADARGDIIPIRVMPYQPNRRR